MATGYYPAGDDPIRIADFGQASGGTVSYTTSSFDATATIDSLSVCATSSPGGSTVLSFQLNVNLGFENGGSWYVYWIQDVAFLNTSNNYIPFLDNVWNFSGSSASIYPSTLSGNGQIGSSSGIGFYNEAAA